MSDELPAINGADFDYRQDELFSAEPKDTKRCQYCRIEKGLSAFYYFKCYGRYSHNCKSCDKAIYRGKYKVNPSLKTLKKKNNAKFSEQKKIQRKRYRRKPVNLMSVLMEGWIGRQRLALAIRLLRYTPEELVKYLESLWEPGMNWDNYGFRGDKWNVDHITPCCVFDLCETKQFIHCHRLANLRPQWANINQNDSGNRSKPVPRNLFL
jgi:hypothetical protein